MDIIKVFVKTVLRTVYRILIQEHHFSRFTSQVQHYIALVKYFPSYL